MQPLRDKNPCHRRRGGHHGVRGRADLGDLEVRERADHGADLEVRERADREERERADLGPHRRRRSP